MFRLCGKRSLSRLLTSKVFKTPSNSMYYLSINNSRVNTNPSLSIRFNSTNVNTENEKDKEMKNDEETSSETNSTETVNSNTDSDTAPQEPEKHSYASASTQLKKFDDDEYDDWEPKTAKEKVGYYSQLAFILGLMGVGIGCVYIFLKEVNPFGRSPQAIFDHAVDRLIIKDEILSITGTNPRAYGRDHGTQTEGRRNIVDSRVYKVEGDGSTRTRVRFNIKGSKGRVLVWAEVSDKMPSNEYVYLIAQDMRNGKVVTIEDNRDRLETQMNMNNMGVGQSGASTGEAKNALMKLLGANNK